MKITGKVTKGLGIGKKLGLPPTMNLCVSKLPRNFEHGIYAVRVSTPAGKFGGVLHFGLRPAVKAPLSFEVHAFGLNKNCLGARVSVVIIGSRLREVKNFRTISALKKQIARDIAAAKKALRVSGSGVRARGS